jgi:chromate reductase
LADTFWDSHFGALTDQFGIAWMVSCPIKKQIIQMKKIIAFGASSSKDSINRELAKFASDQLKNCSVEMLDLNNFEMPIFSVDIEKESGIPQLALDFKSKIRECDGIIISFAEHNGSYSAAFKNIFDWVSRIEADLWLNKAMLLMATSPGARGGIGVLETAYARFARVNPNVVPKFSLPSFHDNFEPADGIVNPELRKELLDLIQQFETKI